MASGPKTRLALQREQTLGAIPRKSENPTGNAALIAKIVAQTAARGRITFARFMELALYDPEDGYYAGGYAKIGREGDFFTNVSVGPLFGRLIAAQFKEVWHKLGRPGVFTIVEQGAYDGQFAADVLAASTAQHEFFAAANYVIVEPSGRLAQRQRQKLANFTDKVSWRSSPDELLPFTGIHFSNELFDALPVHLLQFPNDNWSELFVTFRDDRFGFEPRACSGGLRPPTLSGKALVDGTYRTEVASAAPNLMRQIANKLKRGLILAVDYGFPRAEYYSSGRREGTLQVRSRHHKLGSPFHEIGYADISTHVEWTSLAEAAQAGGAVPVGFTDQHHFLTGIISELFTPAELQTLTTSDKRALQTLLHPEMLGRNFQVLALAKNFAEPLSGFHFGHSPADALGLSSHR